MTLRITMGSDEEARTVLRLEGRFTESDLLVFDSCVAGRAPTAVGLDLSELRWLDPAAATRLDELVASGARMVAVSPFVECLLARPDPPAPTARGVSGATGPEGRRRSP